MSPEIILLPLKVVRRNIKEQVRARRICSSLKDRGVELALARKLSRLRRIISLLAEMLFLFLALTRRVGIKSKELEFLRIEFLFDLLKSTLKMVIAYLKLLLKASELIFRELTSPKAEIMNPRLFLQLVKRREKLKACFRKFKIESLWYQHF